MTIPLYQETKDPELGKKLLAEHRETIDRYVNRWSGVLPQVVLRQHANQYALDAFASFDSSKGADIKTHMHNHLQRLARLNYEHQNTMKIPEHQIRQISNFRDAENHLRDVLGREAEVHEIADHLSMPIAHVEKIQQNLRKEFVGDGSDLSIPTSSVGMNDERSMKLQDAIGRMPKQSRDVVNMIGQGKTPGQIGVELGLKPYQVSRLKEQIALHMRKVK